MSNVTADALFGAAVLVGTGVVSFLWHTVSDQLQRLEDTQVKQGIALATLTEGQNAMMKSQTQLDRIHNKLLDEVEDAEDAISQLQLATSRLRDRWTEHERFLDAAAADRKLIGLDGD